MLRTPKITLDIPEELCACFIEWQQTFERVNWIKLMRISHRNCVDWPERILISKLYMDQSVHLYICTKGRQDVWRL